MVVVYKVDRLTRSLADFAKLVELFDAQSVSFVSVTQAFNTTTSMGRLTLNVLLSFAQFEREVTGERIRDKIAASKKKGLCPRIACRRRLWKRRLSMRFDRSGRKGRSRRIEIEGSTDTLPIDCLLVGITPPHEPLFRSSAAPQARFLVDAHLIRVVMLPSRLEIDYRADPK